MEVDYSVDALERFLEYAAEKGLMPRQTAMGRKSAALRVLGVLDANEARDLRHVDVDEASRRFSNTQGVKYKPESLRVYASRTKSAVAEFISYAADPASYKPAISHRGRRQSTESGRKRETMQTSTEVHSSGSEDVRADQAHAADSSRQRLVIPIPIRETVVVQLQGIPVDLSRAEAEKIANVVKAYSSDIEKIE